MGVRGFLLPIILSLLHLSPVELTYSAFSQTTVQLSPCEESHVLNVSVHSSLLVTVPPDLSKCSNDTRDKYEVVGFRISTSIVSPLSDAAAAVMAVEHPVVFTARQSNSDEFVSWSAPFNRSSQVYPNVSHTMCPVSNFTSEPGGGTLPLLYIDAFTSAPDNMFFTIEVEPVDNFVLHINQTYSIGVGPASPQVYYFKIPSDVHLVTVEASSKPDNGCTIVSIQNNTCPVNDLLENARSKGIYQTMATSSFITIDPDSFTNREFLLVLVAMDYSTCYTNATNQSDAVSPQERTITIAIREMKPTREYVWAMMLPVVICAVIYCLSVLVCCCYAPRCEPGCIPFQFVWRSNGHDQICCNSIASFKCCARIPARPWPCRCVPWHSSSADSGGDKEKNAKNDVELCVEETRSSTTPDETTPLTGSAEEPPEAPNELKGADLEVRGSRYGTTPSAQSINTRASESGSFEGAQNDGRGDGDAEGDRSSTDSQSAHHVYSWNTVTVGIFYALPALQLVFSEQKILDQSGNQDSCYYNFKCAHPIWFFSAFNNMWSNIGYILLGFLFVLIVIFRHWQYIVRSNKYKNYKEYGVPQYFGIYYAMGFALILEGFMSSFYHICPSNANFQFDTAFMFITGGIILVKVYQNRHPAVQANAFIAFFTFAVIIFFTLVGIYNDGRHPLSVKISFFFLALVVIFLFLAHFYKWNFKLDAPAKDSIYDKCTCSFKPFACFIGCCSGFCLLVKAVIDWLIQPSKWKDFCKNEKFRIAKHIIIFSFNILLGIGICVKYRDVGIATGVLAFFVVNIVLYLFIYCVIKICYGEPWTWLALILPIFIAVSWLLAFHFYGTVTEWKDTPAVSRSLNMECYVLGFYDYHDVWHFLSACGMFTAFLFVLVIDDGVVDIKQKTLLQRAV